ncbi:hypothetical protein DPMN_157454 [Dreissena polymorpha]|uniref:Uncharacterized protein n=1 Tax=Dreissena polymorpha TaxID=45954 RepID=A0A9D4IL28_DREPO|nr:hypothetical protein DPMN_157451 [Dreissena polymorpha]KAH3779649.1 hypothetical protein DPMN_157454 [Dreissena polymorpha]
MLFTVMEIVRIRNSTTVTQDPAYWKLPSSMKRVEYKEVRDNDFTSAKWLKRVKKVKCPYNQCKSMLDGDLKDFYLKPNETGTLFLDKKHPYYYQVQTQHRVTKLKSAY